MKKTYYDILEVKQNASLPVIKAAYKTLMQKYHPDRNKDVNSLDISQEINKAYQILSNPEDRKIYDIHLAQELNKEKLQIEEQIRLEEQRKSSIKEKKLIKQYEDLIKQSQRDIKPIKTNQPKTPSYNYEQLYWQQLLEQQQRNQNFEYQYYKKQRKKDRNRFLFSLSIYLLSVFLIIDFFFHITKINYYETSKNTLQYISTKTKEFQKTSK